jgi:SAM-dependent methyltransferase
MVTEPRPDARYVLGSSLTEHERLVRQAGLIAGSMRHMLTEAGLGPGMSVLDVGCGMGDVSLVAGAFVGTDGHITACDTNPQVIAQARERFDAAGINNVDFVVADIRELQAQRFDAVIGRFVLLYTADPVVVLRRIRELLLPGGVIAFEELELDVLGSKTLGSYPCVPVYEKGKEWALECFRRGGVEMRMGSKLHSVFRAAGLPDPHLNMEIGFRCANDRAVCDFLAGTARSLLPRIIEYGIASAAEVDIDTLADRLHAEGSALDAIYGFAPRVTAWTRV